jgi:hypothetical protein
VGVGVDGMQQEEREKKVIDRGRVSRSEQREKDRTQNPKIKEMH